ncbi:RHS protein [Pectobacterium parmentieri WPP163]|uniref:RHS repeat-associated core domain-containing protein n=3 Tax=Pectobacterium parmentieri TaxID=1905730 RepID=UPI0001B0A755|nr:RHS protein [Pectobacterium parmentieri WPP163]
MARYGYDALGRRTRKTVTWGDSGKQEETRFLWEGFRLLQARQADRTESYLYDPTIWWSPLARITQQPGAPDGDIRWFNTELDGAPLEMTDAEGAVRWSGDYGSFGAVNGQTQDSEGLRHGKQAESQSLRYAGQYADEETGLHYNLFRYYDPTVGRFTTQDPIGLAGGINLYQYAPNPLTWIDPLGLACTKGFNRKNNIASKWVNKLSGKKPDQVHDFLNSKGYVKSTHRTSPNATPHTRYTRTTKNGDVDVLDYHPGGNNAVHKSDYWKVYRNDEVQGRIGHGTFTNYDRINDSPVYVDGILMNIPK